VRDAERAARWAGARRKPRRTRTPVDPVLVDRVRTAAERLTGRSVKLASNRLEILFADEVELAELAEALENAAAS
jgi:2-hydroxychromene-2-carboxylate isomerase